MDFKPESITSVDLPSVTFCYKSLMSNTKLWTIYYEEINKIKKSEVKGTYIIMNEIYNIQPESSLHV